MSSDFITPIVPIKTFEQLKTAMPENSTAEGGSMFKSIFDNAVNDVKETQRDLDEKQYLLATGQLDDPHTLTIAAEQAQLTVDLLVQLRNSAIESYNELIRINL